jgi:hypothetical protein
MMNAFVNAVALNSRIAVARTLGNIGGLLRDRSGVGTEFSAERVLGVSRFDKVYEYVLECRASQLDAAHRLRCGDLTDDRLRVCGQVQVRFDYGRARR